jgi:hypothetical protein
MKLSTTLVEQTLGQLEAEAIPDNHPAIPQLRGLYGDHTFFLDSNGLNIVEPVETTDGKPSRSGQIVNLASWNDDDPPALAPHEPEATDIVIVLGAWQH